MVSKSPMWLCGVDPLPNGLHGLFCGVTNYLLFGMAFEVVVWGCLSTTFPEPRGGLECWNDYLISCSSLVQPKNECICSGSSPSQFSTQPRLLKRVEPQDVRGEQGAPFAPENGCSEDKTYFPFWTAKKRSSFHGQCWFSFRCRSFDHTFWIPSEVTGSRKFCVFNLSSFIHGNGKLTIQCWLQKFFFAHKLCGLYFNHPVIFWTRFAIQNCITFGGTKMIWYSTCYNFVQGKSWVALEVYPRYILT